ncbi:hypothetical protein GWK08_01700 [Leptobacterium flavescens]|uniref:Riboflavin synthase subunit beta n=1 Tax=Leptobacterium flavescens TaxID=472055 RepID=A0A6P0UM65_9FLAO|nr:hypothetical protein [Leptobacterium flavescens]NER12143.1 hypothetical protein [Leptobacterium flavescens]
MRLPTLFKQQKNKTYNYTPRYYDERKERLENLMQRKEVKDDEDYFKGYRRKSYREDWKTIRKKGADKDARLRLYVIVILLLMFTLVALRYVNLDKFF